MMPQKHLIVRYKAITLLTMMSMKSIVPAIFAFALLALGMPSCSSSNVNNPDETIDAAREAVMTGNYARALEICNKIMSSPDTVNLSCQQLCDIGTIYADSYEHDVDAAASITEATLCFEKARRISQDSVMMYIQLLAPDKVPSVLTAIKVLDGMHVDISDYIDADEESHAEMTSEINEIL